MDLAKMTKSALYELAKEKDIPGRSKMTKKDLVKALDPFFTKSQVEEPPVGYEKAEETKPVHKPTEYHIPECYNKDTIVLMPVNPSQEYVYWELSENSMKNYQDKLGISELAIILKVFETGGGRELASVRVGRYGNWFFDLYEPDKTLKAELGLLDNMGNYIAVISSREIKMPSDKVSEEIDSETWMTVGEKIEEIIKLSGVDDMKSHDMPGSMKLHRELMKMIEESVSSSEFLRSDK